MDNENGDDNSTVVDQNRISVLELPTVSENIMKFLPARDLITCSKVCKSWQAVATCIKNRRRNIFVISMPAMEYIPTEDKDIFNTLLNVWSQPVVAILSGYLHQLRNVQAAFHSLIKYETDLLVEEEVILKLVEKIEDNARKVESEMKTFRSPLPKDCTFLHFNVLTRRTRPEHSSIFPSELILVPSIPGLEVQPFFIPAPIKPNFQITRDIEQLFLFRKRECFNANIKCMIVLANSSDFKEEDIIDRSTYAKTALANYIDDETVIVGGVNFSSIGITGIAFCGQVIKVEMSLLRDCECSKTQILSHFQNQKLEQKCGLAFLLSTPDMAASILFVWEERFPSAPLVSFYVRSISFSEPKGKTFLNSCDNCSESTDIVGVLVVMIFDE